MIHLADLKPGVTIDIQFTGIRPGEKLFEEIFHGSEAPVPTQAPGILLASPRTQDVAKVGEIFDQLIDAANREDLDQLLVGIQALVPEYAPAENEVGA
jgi:O-antigen biosynthesis protein WbqV